MSSPGLLVVGLGLLSSRSSTQTADFIRRSAELLSIIIAFVTYKITTKNIRTIRFKKKNRKNSLIVLSVL